MYIHYTLLYLGDPIINELKCKIPYSPSLLLMIMSWYTICMTCVVYVTHLCYMSMLHVYVTYMYIFMWHMYVTCTVLVSCNLIHTCKSHASFFFALASSFFALASNLTCTREHALYMSMVHTYVHAHVCDICMLHVYVTCVCDIHMYVTYMYICMWHMYVTYVCYMCMLRYIHAYVRYHICMLHVYVIYMWMWHTCMYSVCYIHVCTCMLHVYGLSMYGSRTKSHYNYYIT